MWSGRTRAAALALVFCAAGCGGAAQRATTTASLQQRRAAAWHQVVLCARAHGMPSLPDPVIDANGNARFPSSFDKPPAQTRRACEALFNRLIPSTPERSVTQAQLHSLVLFARCMRSHGVTDWPDPNPRGEFPLPTRLVRAGKPAFRTQMMACDHLNPDPRGRIYGARP